MSTQGVILIRVFWGKSENGTAFDIHTRYVINETEYHRTDPSLLVTSLEVLGENLAMNLLRAKDTMPTIASDLDEL